jgi:hypothetical protein
MMASLRRVPENEKGMEDGRHGFRGNYVAGVRDRAESHRMHFQRGLTENRLDVPRVTKEEHH